MTLFDQFVTEALKASPTLSNLRMVVEKELLHHDILRILRDHHLLSSLTFMGGTCLRLCYGGIRLSEDLDFTGGHDFSKEKLSHMGEILVENLQKKYDLQIMVSEPIKDNHPVSTWKIKVETRPESKSLPAQRINIDICALPSYDKRPMMMMNHYKVDMGTSGLVVQVQSREEIYTDKLIAFALRPNRIKYRDLWDILWLHGQGIKPKLDLVSFKIKDRHITKEDFMRSFDERVQFLKEEANAFKEFKNEMYRFLPIEKINSVLEQEDIWTFMTFLMEHFHAQLKGVLLNTFSI